MKLWRFRHTCLSLDRGGNELMSTGDFEGLHSSGKGFGMVGTDEEKDSLLILKKWEKSEMKQRK